MSTKHRMQALVRDRTKPTHELPLKVMPLKK